MGVSGAQWASEEVATGRASGPRAGFWRRFGAALIDGLIVGLAFGILYAVLKGAGYALGLLLGIAYFTYFEGGPLGAGFGKRAMGIRVVDFSTGGPIGYGRAFIRYVGRIVSSLVVYLGYLWMLWDREKQTWHDKMATAVVVPESAYPVTRF
jgi:uncharacterized RDD family membrane protein YckC